MENTSSTYFDSPRELNWKLALFCLAGILVVVTTQSAFGQGHQVVPINVPGARAGFTMWRGRSSPRHRIGGNESFQLTTKKWTTLTPIPQSTIFPGSAAYGQVYCFGGWASWQGSAINNVQIYQP